MKKIELNENERIDDLQIKGYRIIQNPKAFCFGMDAVLLSYFAKIKKNSRVMDLCSGNGVIPLLLDAKYPVSYIEGLEYQEESVQMAVRSVQMNEREEKIVIRQGDVKEVKTICPREEFDYVTCNPPYMVGEHGLKNPDEKKAIARHEIKCTLNDVIEASAWLLKQYGHLIMVHRPFRLAEIIYCLKEHKLEPKRMRLVYPYIDKEPNMVLIDAIKGAKQRVTVEAPLIIYNKDGSYTEEISRLYEQDC